MKTYIVSYIVKRNLKEYEYTKTIKASNAKEAKAIFLEQRIPYAYYAPHPLRITVKAAKAE